MDRTTIPTAHLQAGVPIPTDSPGVSHVMRGAGSEGRRKGAGAQASPADSRPNPCEVIVSGVSYYMFSEGCGAQAR